MSFRLDPTLGCLARRWTCGENLGLDALGSFPASFRDRPPNYVKIFGSLGR